ncbi:PO113 protein, partial [Vidua macroura]|nr:PO113 protein [Vidua macroura]
VTFLGVQITGSYVAPPQIKIRRDIKTLHDAQQLVGSLQWLHTVILIPLEIMSLLYLLLQGKQPWEE